MINLFNKEELRKGINFLSANYPVIKKMKSQYGEPDLNRGTKNIFLSLIKSIISQQISTKAAFSVHNKFQNLYTKINPEIVLNTTNFTLKSIGLSRQKIEYIKSTAKFFNETEYTYEDFNSMEDIKLKEELITIKGVGPWTIDMLLIFALGRSDVFPVGDLAIRKGFNILFNKEYNEKQMIKESEKWKPYRTIFSWYLWKVVDGLWESK